MSKNLFVGVGVGLSVGVLGLGAIATPAIAVTPSNPVLICSKDGNWMDTGTFVKPKRCLDATGEPDKDLIALKYTSKWGGKTVRATGKVVDEAGGITRRLQVKLTKLASAGNVRHYSVVKIRATSKDKWYVFARPWV